MTPKQEATYQMLRDSQYTYYDEVHGDIIMDRPNDYVGEQSSKVSIDHRGMVQNYKDSKNGVK